MLPYPQYKNTCTHAKSHLEIVCVFKRKPTVSNISCYSVSKKLFLCRKTNKPWIKKNRPHIAFIGCVMMNLDAFLNKSCCVTKVCAWCTVYLSHTHAQGQLKCNLSKSHRSGSDRRFICTCFYGLNSVLFLFRSFASCNVYVYIYTSTVTEQLTCFIVCDCCFITKIKICSFPEPSLIHMF